MHALVWPAVQRLGGASAAAMELDRSNAFTQQYAVACKEVAAELGLPVVDLWTSMQQAEVEQGA